MALYSLQQPTVSTHSKAPGFIARLTCESGDHLEFLRSLREEYGDSVVEVSDANTEVFFEAHNFGYLTDGRGVNRKLAEGLEPDVFLPLYGTAADFAAGRSVMVRVSGNIANLEEADFAIRNTVASVLRRRGHQLDELPRSFSLHLEMHDGSPVLTCSGAGMRSALHHLHNVGFEISGGVYDERSRRFRLTPGRVYDKAKHTHVPCDPVAAAIAMSKLLKAEGFRVHGRVVNHTPQPLLGVAPTIGFTSPYLRTGRRTIEVHAVSGDVGPVFQRLQHGTIPQPGGSLLLRGTREEILAKVEQFKDLARESPSVTRLGTRTINALTDVPEKFPAVAVVSDAAAIMENLIPSEAHGSAEEVQRVKSFATTYLSPQYHLTPMQLAGVAFMNARSAAILADDTGGGKTLQMMTAAIMGLPEGRKVLLVCPASLAQQWVENIAKYCTELKPDPAPKVPQWIHRAGLANNAAFMDAWSRVSSKVSLLPESRLQSGVEFRNGTFRVQKERKKSALANNAHREILDALDEPLHTLVVDESQGMRVAGAKYANLAAIRQGKFKSVKIERVLLGSATPMHRAATDLYALFGLLGVKKFQKMDLEQFCKDYCLPKVTFVDGKPKTASAVGIYGYDRLKDQKVPEVVAILKEHMLARPIEQIAPDRILDRVVHSPLPYEPSATLGVRLPEMRQSGELVTLPASVAEEIRSAGHGREYALLADAKVPATVSLARDLLKRIPANEKVVIFTEFIETSRKISEALLGGAEPLHSFRLNAQEMTDTARSADYKTKTEFVRAAASDLESRVIVLTAGAGGTGIDGLHEIARNSILNDFSPIGGRVNQELGRTHRIFQHGLPSDQRPNETYIMVANEESDISMYRDMIERRHQIQFLREQGLAQLIDGAASVASAEVAHMDMSSALRVLVQADPASWERMTSRVSDYSSLAREQSFENAVMGDLPTDTDQLASVNEALDRVDGIEHRAKSAKGKDEDEMPLFAT